MLQIKEISKKYITGELEQTALDKVSLNLRDNEFVAILGPSGSGKTTLLNVIGGLDRYDSGDLIINGISTKKYKDRDWDSYRNHTIGFVFQSYNLIPHQSILSNVELALTISGVGKSERRRRAKEALIKVGLGEQLHKKPNQMSGGQMQRVAIARALVNDPDILLADEPTGALDTETSVQVMDLLKEVAKDRLVVMVTHNPELAEEYATRIVKLRDGKVIDDTDAFQVDTKAVEKPRHENMGKSSMSLFTALALSFNNLRTKKGRTFLTAFAGSIGIIGISLILSISTGVNDYITNLQKDTMTSYPIEIDEETFDLSSMISAGGRPGEKDSIHELDAVYSDSSRLERASTAMTSLTENNLTEFKKYLEDKDSEVQQYLGVNGVVYSYDTKFNVYTYDTEDKLINTDGVELVAKNSPASMMSGMAGMESFTKMMTSSNFEELLAGTSDDLVSPVVQESYELLYGDWPTNYNEVVCFLDENNEITITALYEMGLLPSTEYKDVMTKIENSEEVEFEEHSWSYKDICNQTFYLVPACDFYTENSEGTFDYAGGDANKIENLLTDAVELKIVGVVSPKEDATYSAVRSVIGYSSALTDYIIEHTSDSPVVTAQMESQDINVLSGITFSPSDDATKIADAKEYLEHLNVSEKAALYTSMMMSVSGENAGETTDMSEMNDSSDASVLSEADISQMSEVPDMSQVDLSQMGEVPTSEAEMAAALDYYLEDPEDDTLLLIYDTYVSSGSYDDNMDSFGVVSVEAPASISIYADSFEDKDAIADCIKNYNKTVSEDNQITYTDYVGMLMSSVTTIVNVISYVLIAFVAVSLVVSSIMIGIITYISVLERTKEIGILRAIGASKHNVSQVFNAETFIVGACAGALGIGITLLLLIPGNAILHSVTGLTTIHAALPVGSAIFLIILSIFLTLLGGFIPAKMAAKKDPVKALRTE